MENNPLKPQNTNKQLFKITVIIFVNPSLYTLLYNPVARAWRLLIYENI